MNNLFGYADKYLQKSDWKDIALLKFCLFSMGVLMGILIGRRWPKKNRKAAVMAAMLVFIGTYIPLMTKFFGIVMEKEE